MLHLLCTLVAAPFQFLHHSVLKAILKVVMHETLDSVAREEPSILLLLLPERNQTATGGPVTKTANVTWCLFKAQRVRLGSIWW